MPSLTAVAEQLPRRTRGAPVLVTGSHRSGTTWVGRMIARSPEFLYVHEPFNITSPTPFFTGRCSHWFEYVHDDNSVAGHGMRRLSAFELEPLLRLTRIRGVRGRHGAKWQLLHLWKLAQAKAIGRRLLVKDPLAFFSTPWLNRELGFRPLVMIRHPAAFVGALKHANWRFDFKNLEDQPALVRDYLEPWSAAIAEAARRPPDFVPMACLLWNVIHDVMGRFQDAFPEWYFLRHEDIAQDPVGGFERVFDWLGLPLRSDVRAHILEHSLAEPTAVVGLLDVRRNSQSQLYTWKKRLTAGEIGLVRKETESIAARFYDDSNWD